MREGEVEILRLTVPANRVLALAPDERYAYYLLGHFFNELKFLHKLLAFAMPTHEDNRPLRVQPEMGQALVLLRIAGGKLYEAKVALDKPPFVDVLARSFLPLLENGPDRLKAFRRGVSKAKWLADLRNKHSFHYPTLHEWQHLIEAQGEWTDDDVFMAKQSGNMFFAGSDAMAQHWMFGQLDAQDPRTAVEPMIDGLLKLLGSFNSLIENLLAAFVAKRLLANRVEPVLAGSIAAPDFESIRLPFWTSMPTRSVDSKAADAPTCSSDTAPPPRTAHS
jgi:hypothetical protein